MASYDTEHDTTNPNATTTSHARRPDLSTFFASLSEITPSDTSTRTRPDAVPVPGDVSAVYRSLAEAFDVMRREQDDPSPSNNPTTASPDAADDDHTSLLSVMISSLLSTADHPPREVKGVSDEYITALDRVPKSQLSSLAKSRPKDAVCPICANPFLDDPYPLVVRLPCHKTHLFDLECIRPWLRTEGTCPMDRVDFAKKEREKREALETRLRKEREEDGEEEWDGMYG